jgi:DNA replication protein DnaC
MLAVGLAIAACQAGFSIYFTTLDDLVRNLNPKFPWPQRPRLLLPARSRCFGLAS